MKSQTLIDILQKSVCTFSRHPALTMRMGYRTVTLSYVDVDRISRRVAVFLARQGIQRGDRVALCAPNSPYWVCIFWGCLLQGVVLVPLAPQYTQSMLEKIIDGAQPKLFFSSVMGRYQGALPTYIVEHLPEWILGCDVDEFVAVEHAANDIVEIMYTSGTTGDPKGVVLTHGNIMANLVVLHGTDCVPKKGERMLSILPLSHMLEQTNGFLLPFSVGVQIIFAHSHAAVQSLMQRYRIRKMVVVPEFLKLMAARLEGGMRERGLTWFLKRLMSIAHHVRYKFLRRLVTWPLRRAMVTSLDTLACGGSLLDPKLEQFWNDLGITILQGYGLTETAPVISINTYAYRKEGSLGRVLSNLQMRVVDGGECQVKGASVFAGYYNDPEKTKGSFTDDGWFKTGDMLTVDDDGFLFFKGRKKYMIKGPGAQNIFPEDIEAVLNHQSEIRDSCVLGIITLSGMLEIHAVLILAQEGADFVSCIEAANEHLASYQHITGWSVWPEGDFPRSVTRKVKREAVLEWVRARGSKEPVHQISQTSCLKQILADVTSVPIETLHETTLLVADLKFDSLMRIELVARVEELFNIMLDERLITNKTTIGDLEKTLRSAPPIKKMPHVKQWPGQWWARGIRVAMWRIQWLISRVWITLEVQGLEHLGGVKGPVIFMPNHVSLIDGAIVGIALPKVFQRRISFAAAYDVLYEEFRRVRWFVELFSYAFPFPRRESEHVATGLLNMGSMLDKGYNVVFFPEGKVSLDGNLQPLKGGAGLIALEMGVSVVPIRIVGLEKLVPYDGLLPRARGVVTVKICKPISFTHDTSYQQANDQLEQALRELHEV